MKSIALNKEKRSGINVSLWIAQGLLAALYLMAGGNKMLQSIENLTAMLPWVAETPSGLVRFIGISEILGAAGLILPSWLKIQPRLTPYAAAGLAVVQILAITFHISLGEASVIGINFVFLAVAVFIFWGRIVKHPVNAR
jgi:putative oxidoreductase